MIFKSILLFSTLVFCLAAYSQSANQGSIDSSLAKKITISNFCLCKTSLTDLRLLDPDLKEVDVEEMDLCKDGFVQDSRFVNRKGFESQKYPGIIFQKEENSDYISKIRLTKEFVGKLPDGTAIDMHSLLAKDILKPNPKFATWGSRGCSDYWSLSNDTLLFFVKIDKDKKPQYPVDEIYYGDKPIEGIDLVMSCYSIFERANNMYKKLFNDPVFFIDSINVTRIEMMQYQPSQIASLSVYKDTNAIKLVGPQGKDGVIYVETKKFAAKRYWRFFASKSPEYLNTVPTPEADTSVIYILNGKVLKENFEGDLAAIKNSNFIDLKIIGKDDLYKQYNVADKAFGVLIKTIKKQKQ